jgi:putative (di)nucleoside polyphosphate hydrolase
MYNNTVHDDTKYRLNVGMVILNQFGNIFIAKRIDSRGSKTWQMPQGGVMEGETEENAVFRELSEEIGTNNVSISRVSNGYFYYRIPELMKIKFWNGKFDGQKQRWFLVNFLGNDSDINIHTESPEFCQWSWCKPLEVQNCAIEFKRDTYIKVLKEFNIL